MADTDDLDLVRLFGLSSEEASGLGLGSIDGHAQGDTRRNTPRASARPRLAAQALDGEGIAGLPEHAEPAGGASRRRTADTPPRVAQPVASDDELALLSLLDGAAASRSIYTGYDAERGLSLAAVAEPLPRPTKSETAGLPTAAVAPPVTPSPPHDAIDADTAARFIIVNEQDAPHYGDADLVSLFNLSADEALGLGLSPAESKVLDIEDGSQRNAPVDSAVAGSAYPTMRLHAIDELSSGASAVADAGPLAAPCEQPRGSDLSRDPLQTAPETGKVSGVPPAGARSTVQASGPDNQGGTEPARIAGRQTESPVRNDAVSAIGQDQPQDAEGAAERAPNHLAAIDPDLLDAYSEESAELLDGLHVELERLESDSDDHGALLEIRRVIHTLKGGAKMCGFEQVATLTHSCENLLDVIAEGSAALSAEALHTLFDCEPVLRAAVHAAITGQSSDIEGLNALAARFDTLCAQAVTAVESGRPDQDGDSPAPGAENILSIDDLIPAKRHAPSRLQPSAGSGATAPGELHASSEPVLKECPPPGAIHPTDSTRKHPGAAAADTTPHLTGETGPPAGAAAPSGAETATAAASSEAADIPPANGAAAEPTWPAATPRIPALAAAAPRTGGGAAEPGSRPAGRRGPNSITVDLSKVDAVVAKLTEMAAHRVSSQGMLGRLLEGAEDARRNVTRLRSLVMHLGNECASMQPEDVVRDDDLNLETYNTLNTLVLQLQEAISDQQALVHAIHDTITSHWSLQAMEGRIDADIHSALMSIRLVPIANIRVRLDSVVRQAAEATGKQVRWQLQGGSVAVEKNVFDRLFEPLMHLLRNAVDHGIEMPAARREAGKPENGLIVVAATQEGSQISLAVTDDGAGIVPNKIAALAVERGIITAAQAGAMSHEQKMGLIFTPGFSTADSVSHISGRGVGMDAVREACLRMGGSIDVSSRPGAGTTFTMRLPLSLSVTRGLIVRDGGCLMALPVAHVIALHLVPVADVVDTKHGRVARIEGQELPVYYLPSLPGAGPASYVQNGEVNVLQVAHEGGSVGLLIEDVVREEEILIKTPPSLLQGAKPLLGAHVLPDGKVVPVVNLPQMLAQVRPVAMLTAPREDADGQDRLALIVDDSMSMRVALSGTLQSAGFKVLTARDGQEALEVLKREGMPSLITLDVEMPRMDGLETLFAIRQMNGAQDVPVFMMTSRGGAKHRRAAEQLGATRYFTKPYRDSELANAARVACAMPITAA